MDVDELLTTEQAAQLAGVTPAAIRQWAHRGRLSAAGLDHNGRRLYRLLAVARAEHATRAGARRQPARPTSS